MCHKTKKAAERVRVWNARTRKGRESLDALWEKKVSPRFKRKTVPNSFWPKEAKKNIRKNNTAQSLGTGGFGSVTKSRLTLHDPSDRSTSGLPVLHHLLESAQVHVHCISAAIQPAHPLSSSSSLEKGTANHPSIFAMRTP